MNDAAGPVLADFEGDWRLERVIEDQKADQLLHFTGTGTFTRDLDGMLYHEAGKLVLPDNSRMEASRSYRWLENDEQVEVYFEDGSFFHSFSLVLETSADHWCDPDTYAVSYDFSDWPRWRSRWSVNGPRKEYVMDTRFWRP